MESNSEEAEDFSEASVSEPVKPELWRTVTEPSKVIETYYSEGNFYHADCIEELSKLAQTSHKNVRDTLSRLRKRDERAGKFVPAAPRQQYEFSDLQRHILEEAFAGEFAHPRQVTPDGTRELAKVAGLTVKQVNNWFCNQRRKQDGRSLEKDKKRRERIREDRIRKGLGRVSLFSPSQLDLFEEYHLKSKAARAEGKKFKVPYTELVQKTGQDRKKIRDWFSKRKLRQRKGEENSENEEDEEDGSSESREESREEDDNIATPPNGQPVLSTENTLQNLLKLLENQSD